MNDGKEVVKRRSDELGICLCILVAPACQGYAPPQSPAVASVASASRASCAAGPGALSTAPVAMGEVEPSLIYLQPFEPEVYSLDRASATMLSGPCASSVTAMVLDKVGLSDGKVYQANLGGIAPWPVAYSSMFNRANLDKSQLPDIPNAQFVHAVAVEGRRYAGLWKQKDGSLIVDFKVPEAGGRAIDVRPLLRSRLPLRSVSYFPAPDTRSGGLYLVQEAAPGQVRVIRFSWWHRK
jgi:hypothetical protein